MSPAQWARVRGELGAASRQAEWESLLAGKQVDAVLVARESDEEARADQRFCKLIQDGVPLLVAHPVVDSMLLYYELDMIRRESQSVVLPHLLWRWHPAAHHLAALVEQGAESPIGAVGQAIFERATHDRDKRSVLTHFARDVDLIRFACCDPRRLAALGELDHPETYANLGVQMSAENGMGVRWSVGPVEEAEGGRLTMIGAGGKAVLHMPEGAAWRWEVRRDGLTDVEEFVNWDGPTAALQELAAAIARAQDHGDWNDAARSVELAEAIDRSLKRGRAIELHNEDFTDIGTFKGTMTSLGCAMLFGILFLLGGVAIVGAMLRQAGGNKWGDALKAWPYWLAGLLIVFLLGQFVLKLAAPPTRDDKSDDE